MPGETRFRKATRRNIAAKILIDGTSGSGKTLTSLLIALGIVGPQGRVGLLDTQNGQSRRYADLFDFGLITMRKNYHPQNFVDVIEGDAVEAELDCLIIDSASHEWSGRGGCLELSKRPTGPDDWKTVTPLHQAFVEAIIQAPYPIIVTCRTKTVWEYKPDERGRIKPYRIGTDAIQRQEFEYEFDLWLRLDGNHVASVEKSTFGDYVPAGSTISLPGLNLGYAIRGWLDGTPLDVLPPLDGGSLDDALAADAFTPAVLDNGLDDDADVELGESDQDDAYDNADVDEDGSHEHDATAPVPNLPAAQTQQTRGSVAARPVVNQSATTTRGRGATNSPLPAQTSEPPGSGRSAGASTRPNGSGATSTTVQNTPRSPQAARTAAQATRAASDVTDDATGTVGDPATTTEAGSAQCATCGEKVYPHVLYTVNGTEFRGSVLMRQSRAAFDGNVYCGDHYLAQQRKARRRNPVVQSA